MTRRRSSWRPASSPNAPTRCGKFLRGSSVPIASTNGAPSSCAADVRRHVGRVAERGDAERDHDEAPGGPQAPAEDLLDLVGDELRAGVHGRAPPNRAPDDRLEGPHLGRAQLGVAHERAVVDADDASAAGSAARGSSSRARPAPGAASGRCGARRRAPTTRSSTRAGIGTKRVSGGSSARWRRARALSVYGTRSGPASSTRERGNDLRASRRRHRCAGRSAA